MRNLAILSVSSNHVLRGNADFQFCRFEFDSTSCAFFFFYLLYFWCPFIYTIQNTFIDNYIKWKINSSCISPTLHSCLLVLYHACLCGQEHELESVVGPSQCSYLPGSLLFRASKECQRRSLAILWTQDTNKTQPKILKC